MSGCCINNWPRHVEVEVRRAIIKWGQRNQFDWNDSSWGACRGRGWTSTLPSDHPALGVLDMNIMCLSSWNCTSCFDFCLDLSSSPLCLPFLLPLSFCIQQLLFACLPYILGSKQLRNQSRQWRSIYTARRKQPAKQKGNCPVCKVAKKPSRVGRRGLTPGKGGRVRSNNNWEVRKDIGVSMVICKHWIWTSHRSVMGK